MQSCGHEHHEQCDHSHDGPDRGEESSLFQQIDFAGVRCFNTTATDVTKIFRPWDQRFETENSIESDADEQLILFVPFTSMIKLKSIGILGPNDDTAPASVKVFINRDDIDFDSVDSITPIQEFDLVRECPSDFLPEYQTKLTKFQNVRNVTLYFDENFGADTTILNYVGFKGEWTNINKDPIITIYEAAPNPADHQKIADKMTNSNAIQ
jgi:hypothetical protein